MICRATQPEPCCCSDIPEMSELVFTFSARGPLLCDPPAEIRLTIPAHMIASSSFSGHKEDYRQFMNRLFGA